MVAVTLCVPVAVTLQHFESEPTLKAAVRDLLEEMVCNTALVPAEHKAAASVLRVLTSTDDDTPKKVDLDLLLTPPTVGRHPPMQYPAGGRHPHQR